MPPVLIDELFLDDAWMRIARASAIELVKSGAGRRVYRLTHASGVFYVKQHIRRGILLRIKDALLHDPARREFDAGGYAARHGVPAVATLAWCARDLSGARRAAALVTRGETEARPLTRAWLEALATGDGGTPRAAALVAGLARLLAAAHNGAFLHPDNHPGNVLVRTGADEAACLYVDLYGARCGREVSVADAAGNLAALDLWFAPRATRTQRLRFLKTYLGQRRRPPARGALGGFVDAIAGRRHRHAQRLFRQRDRRIGRRSAFFDRQRAQDGATVVATRRFRRAAELLDLPEPDAPAPAGEVGAGPAADASETYYAPNRITALAWRLAGSPAWRKYRSACLLMNRDLPTVAPLACRWTQDRWGIRNCAWRRLRPPDAAALREWLEVLEGQPRGDLLDRVGRLVADTAARGAVVIDPGLLTVEVSGILRGATRVYWAGVQVEVVRVPAPRHALVWMLARFARSAGGDPAVRVVDRARVVRACCRRYGYVGSGGDWRTVWRAVAADRSPG